MQDIVLVDNTVLSNFALVSRPDLVLSLWGPRCATTPAVMNEYRAGVTSRGMSPAAWRELTLLELTPPETVFADSLSASLGAGERSCLALAVHRQGLLVSDDANARRAAKRHQVPVSGTIGILVLTVRQGHLSLKRANSLLSEMIDLGYRSPVKTLDELLA